MTLIFPFRSGIPRTDEDDVDDRVYRTTHTLCDREMEYLSHFVTSLKVNVCAEAIDLLCLVRGLV